MDEEAVIGRDLIPDACLCESLSAVAIIVIDYSGVAGAIPILEIELGPLRLDRKLEPRPLVRIRNASDVRVDPRALVGVAIVR